ncbi:MAG: asparaginase [Alphaproteobacteria bacterium]|nr:asparaginase [Alphaproteobacteria bacterium]
MNDLHVNHNSHPPRDDQASPIMVEVTRGDIVESQHRGRAAVVDREGAVILSWGDIEAPVYPRSAIKPLQAIPLIESGAADAYGATDTEIAVGCASHGGEHMHVEAITAWLARCGLSVTDLECGSHTPSHGPSSDDLVRQDAAFHAAHNNCSGKHAAMLVTAKHLGDPTAGYIDYTHPVQQRVLGVLEQMCGLDLASAPRGVDGCSIPTIAVPLGNLALAFARFADPGDEVPARRADAIRRIHAALAAAPEMIAGTGRYCSDVIRATEGKVLVKTGAEGVFCGAVPALGLGIALKCEDGAKRASEAMMTAILMRIGAIDEVTLQSIDQALPQPILNRNLRVVGEVRTTAVLRAE